MRSLATHCHFGLGKLLCRTGNNEQGHEHLTIATVMYSEMEMAKRCGRVDANDPERSSVSMCLRQAMSISLCNAARIET
jgi:hypothetical protein